MKLNVWIKAARLRTLPLSLSGVALVAILTYNNPFFDWTTLVLIVLVTLLLQVLSNFANDYGDGIKGVDDENRLGPVRVFQSGKVNAKQLRKAIYITAFLTLLTGVYLLISMSEKLETKAIVTLLVLGIAAIFAALFYTIGKKAYGYFGLGDLFVFLFFGLFCVLGSYVLLTGGLNELIYFPAISIGLLSAGVLNLNNIRDVENDTRHNKRTLIVFIGKQNGVYYHFFLLFGAWLSSLVYWYLQNKEIQGLVYLIISPLFFFHLKRVYRTKELYELDKELKVLSLSTLLFAIVFSISQVL